jgi:membrane glycosyltransferase
MAKFRRFIQICLFLDTLVVAFPFVRAELGYVGDERLEWAMVWVFAAGVFVWILLSFVLALSVVIDLRNSGR